MSVLLLLLFSAVAFGQQFSGDSRIVPLFPAVYGGYYTAVRKKSHHICLLLACDIGHFRRLPLVLCSVLLLLLLKNIYNILVGNWPTSLGSSMLLAQKITLCRKLLLVCSQVGAEFYVDDFSPSPNVFAAKLAKMLAMGAQMGTFQAL